MKDYKKISIKVHKELKKWKTCSDMKVNNREELSIAYSPGVAGPCLEIVKDKKQVYKLTSKRNTVAIISNGTAVLGLGDIGPEAALPVMEGKALLFQKFGSIDAVPIVVNEKDPNKFIEFVKQIAPSFGGINLEDIKAPECVEIEKTLKEKLDIPVFHDDQHGTAIVVAAALINCQRLTKKDPNKLKVVLSGTGAAGSSIARLISMIGYKNIYAFNKNGVVKKDNIQIHDNVVKSLISENIIISPNDHINDLKELMKNTDIFIGVSAPNIVTSDMIRSMNKNPWIFAMANPDPEIMPLKAKKAGAFIVGTGRSDYNNQINNLSAFPGVFRGALDARISNITEDMKIEAAKAIAYFLNEDEINVENIIPSALNLEVPYAVANAIKKCYKKEMHND